MRIALVSDADAAGLREPLTRLLVGRGLRPELTELDGRSPYPGPAAGSPPELSVLLLRAEALVPELYRARALLGPPAAREAICDRAVEAVLDRVRALRRGGGAVLVADFPAPLRSPLGIQDAAVPLGLRASIRRINEGVEGGVRGIEGAGVLARAAAAARLGGAHSAPGSPALAFALAREIDRHVAALRGLTRRALILDLDNTLWGGAGSEILLSPEGGGRPWYAFQQACVDLRDRGVRLAIAARGERGPALEILARHPHSLLRPEDFDAVEIGWGDKVTCCLRIAGRLGLGLNELAFFDDNPVERQRVAAALPGVAVIPVPRDPSRFVEALWGSAAFESAEPVLGAPGRLWLVA